MIHQLVNILSPYYTDFFEPKLEESKRFCPPTVIFLGRRQVSFDDKVIVVEVERIPESEKGSTWYSAEDRSEFTKRHSKRHGLDEQHARSYNHIRRVLLHQNAYKQMGTREYTGLDVISRQCSRHTKIRARKTAEAVAMEVKRWSKPCFSNYFGYTSLRDTEDMFNLNFVFDLFSLDPFCGSENVRKCGILAF